MGKLNNSFKDSPLDTEDDQTSNMAIDWQQLLVDFQNKPVDETMRNIMEKFLTKENVEFDQICLILKHYILITNETGAEKPYLDFFLAHNQQVYVNQLVERFNKASQNPNSQWMITEIIKLISSICSTDQAGLLLSSAQFSTFLLSSVFDLEILTKLKFQQHGLSMTEAAILTNIFETISNLCEIKIELINFVTKSHIEWLADALIGVQKSHKDLTISIAHLLHLICQHSPSTTTDILVDLYLNKNFFLECMEYLSNINNTEDSSTNNDPSASLNARLNLIASLVSLITSNKTEITLNKSEFLLKIFRDYANLIQYSLNLNLNESNIKNGNRPIQELMGDIECQNNDEESDEDTKAIIKSLEQSIESKILSIDLVTTISSYFMNEEVSQATEEDYESWDDDDMDDNNNNQCEADMELTETHGSKVIDPVYVTELKQIVSDFNLMSLLVKTIGNDDENILQETDRIEHIYNSVKLIRNEALKTYLLIIENFYLNNSKDSNTIDVENLFNLLNLLAKKSAQDLEFLLGSEKKNESILKFVEVIYDLFVYFNNNSVLTHEHKLTIVNLVKDILLKFKTNVVDLCVRLARIIGLIAIKERDLNMKNGADLLQISAKILIELAIGSFELGDQNSLETLRLNAEILDLIIDLFGEDSLAGLEKSLNFIEKIKWFNEKFYAKYKKIGKKQKIEKDHSLILKTVKDNFKPFVDYKLKNSK